MIAAKSPPPVNEQEARRFLGLLGIDPAAAWFRTLTPNKGANIRRRDPNRQGWAADLHGFNAAELAADCAAGGSIYLITGNASDNSGRNKQGQPTGCVIDDDVTSCNSLFVEWDSIPIPDQVIAWQTLALPEPTAMALTGGKSVHTYWALTEAIDPATWRALTARLIAYCQSDSSCSNPSRLMRLPGGVYFDKKTGAPTGRAEIIHDSGRRYSVAEIEAALAAGEARKPDSFDFTTPPPSMAGLSDPPRGDFPIRTMEEIRDGLAAIPRRVGGGDDTYKKYRNILWGLIKACEEAGSSAEVAISMMESHSPSATCNWNIKQTANSGGQHIRSETFWWHARDAGWRPRGDTQQSSVASAASPSEPAQQSHGGINADLEMKQKPKIRTLAPHEVVAQLPQRLGGTPRLNIRTNDFEAGGKVYTADDAGRLYVHLCGEAERWPSQATFDVFVELAKDRAFDPVEEELNRLGKTVEPLPMDQWERLDQHLLGIDDPIAAKFLPQFLLSAVARVFRPGCGVRRSPVLIGPQWRGKTKLGAILFGQAHWIENVTDLGKDDLLRLQSAWGVELSELDGITRRKDQEALKAFLTATQDAFRAPYAKATTKHHRRCVFWGTANGPPLRDLSGSTRFVCIKLPDQMLPLDWAREHRDPIWSRAVALYRQVPADQEPWDHSTEEERKAIEERNANHQETDPWAEEVAQHLRSATDRPVSVAYLLDRMDIPKGQRNNAMAARVRQLAEAVGWVMERRRPIGSEEKKQGLWPADPLAASTGHPGRPVGTPRGAQENASQGQGSDDPGHPGHPYSIKVDREINREEGDTHAQPFDTFGVPGVPTSPEVAPALGSGWAPRADFGVPKLPIRGAQAAQRRVQACEPGPLPPGVYLVINDPGGFRMEVFGPEGDPQARRMAINADDVQPID